MQLGHAVSLTTLHARGGKSFNEAEGADTMHKFKRVAICVRRVGTRSSGRHFRSPPNQWPTQFWSYSLKYRLWNAQILISKSKLHYWYVSIKSLHCPGLLGRFTVHLHFTVGQDVLGNPSGNPTTTSCTHSPLTSSGALHLKYTD